jgi:hypothetical protein
MAEVNIENMEQNAEMFMHKMGFAHDESGLDMTDEQLVNFLLLCQQNYIMGDEDEDEEEYEEMDDGGSVKVKVMRLGSGDDMRSMMDELLGHGGPKMDY